MVRFACCVTPVCFKRLMLRPRKQVSCVVPLCSSVGSVPPILVGRCTRRWKHLAPVKRNSEVWQIGNVDVDVSVDIESHPVDSSTPQNVQFKSKE